MDKKIKRYLIKYVNRVENMTEKDIEAEYKKIIENNNSTSYWAAYAILFADLVFIASTIFSLVVAIKAKGDIFIPINLLIISIFVGFFVAKSLFKTGQDKKTLQALEIKKRNKNQA